MLSLVACILWLYYLFLMETHPTTHGVSPSKSIWAIPSGFFITYNHNVVTPIAIESDLPCMKCMEIKWMEMKYMK